MSESRKTKQIRWIYHETRPMARLREQFEVEKELSARLRIDDKQARRAAYGPVYDELLRRFPDNGMIAKKQNQPLIERQVWNALRMTHGLLRPDMVFMELGPGDCTFSFAVCERVKKVIAVDVSEEITRSGSVPRNFELILTDGTSVPVAPESIDFAYSNQMMEHLHPEDGEEQLVNIFLALRQGGKYLCRTPHSLSGPHDISIWFSNHPEGMHLKEYTFKEMRDVFRRVGFRKIQAIVGAKGHYLPLPLPIGCMVLFERLLYVIPGGRTIARTLLVRAILGMQVLATK